MKKSMAFSLVLLILVGFCVSRVKYNVVFLKNRLKKINAEIEKCCDDLKVYSAEWSYLNDPKRLKQLCSKYLPTLRPTEIKQIIDYRTIISSDLDRNVSSAFGAFLDEAIDGANEAEKR